MSKRQNMEEYGEGLRAGEKSERQRIATMIECKAAAYFVRREQDRADLLLRLVDEIKNLPK